MKYNTERITYNLDLGEFMLGEFVFEVNSLYAHLEQLTDQRQKRGVRYRLADALTLIILAKLGGEDKPRGMAGWLKHRGAELARALRLPRASMPHQTTISRIMGGGVDVEELEEVLRRYFDGVAQASQEVLITIDGKTLRGTIPVGQSQGVHLLAAYLPGEGVVLSQVAVASKENEIVAAPRLLERLDLRHKIVAGDALHTQRAISVTIVQAGGDYLWQVKDNQPQLKADIAHLFAPQQCAPATSPLPTDFQRVTEYAYGHGRQEKRTLTSSSMLNDYLDWPYVGQVFQLEYQALNLSTGEVVRETHYGLTSLTREQADPQRLLSLKRRYWQIENRLHYRRDVSLGEDHSRLRTGHAPQTLACLNNLVLALLDRLDFQTVPDARRFFNARPLEALKLFFFSP